MLKPSAASPSLPTLRELEVHFEDKVKAVRKELDTLLKEKQITLELAKDFWKFVKSKQVKKIKASMGRHGARPRKVAAKFRPL